jgi:hypothetical protein
MLAIYNGGRYKEGSNNGKRRNEEENKMNKTEAKNLINEDKILDDTGIYWGTMRRTWVGEWYLKDIHGKVTVRVTEEGERRTYRDALRGIQQAFDARVSKDNPEPFWNWSLECNKR